MLQVSYDAGPAAPVRVDPAQVRHSGLELAQVGSGLRTDVERAGWALPTAGGGNAGWGAGSAAVGAAAQWRGKLAGLGGQLDELGERFVAAADSYQRCDARAGAVMPR